MATHPMGNVSRFTWFLILWIVVGGCSTQEQIEGAYGHMRGYLGKQSVNGTAALAEMFVQSGWKVQRWSRMSPRLKRADAIVWFPDSFRPPTAGHRQFIDDWFQRGQGRTLIYVGRDYDARITYWEKMILEAGDGPKKNIQMQLDAARVEHKTARGEISEDQYAGWFVARGDNKGRRTIRTLSGPWAGDLDVGQIDIELHTRYDAAGHDDLPAGAHDEILPHVAPLLSSEGDMLAGRVWHDHWNGGQVIFMTNGSYLLNLPLVNHEHRKLARRLVESVSQAGPADTDQTVVFLVSDPDGPKVYDEEPRPDWASGFEAFVSWPLGVILLHLFGWGLIYCTWRFPIFGKPRKRPQETTSDFGKHVAALGQQLQSTGDVHYARNKLEHYNQTIS